MENWTKFDTLSLSKIMLNNTKTKTFKERGWKNVKNKNSFNESLLNSYY